MMAVIYIFYVSFLNLVANSEISVVVKLSGIDEYACMLTLCSHGDRELFGIICLASGILCVTLTSVEFWRIFNI